MKTYKVLSWTRMTNSRNGNPRYAFLLRESESDVLYLGTTKPDASFVYGLASHPETIRATLHETASGRSYMVGGSTR